MKNGIENRDILLKALKEVMEGEEGVLFAYLYGSYAYGVVHSESDIDVAVYLNPSDMKEYLQKEKRILSALIDKIRTDIIDLGILNVLPLILQYHILKEGIPIFIKDEKGRIDFEIRVMERFFEMKPYLDEYREMLFLRIQTGI